MKTKKEITLEENFQKKKQEEEKKKEIINLIRSLMDDYPHIRREVDEGNFLHNTSLTILMHAKLQLLKLDREKECYSGKEREKKLREILENMRRREKQLEREKRKEQPKEKSKDKKIQRNPKEL